MKGPVFIVGCPRSGTSFLYHLMLSAGGFAEFRTQMNVYDVLEPIYGDLRVLANRRRMMKDWLQSKAFAVSGLEAGEIEKKVLLTCCAFTATFHKQNSSTSFAILEMLHCL
jgi:hypothetical protein